MQKGDIVSGNLAGIFLGLGLFGFYTCLLAVTLWVVQRQQRKFPFVIGAVMAIYLLNVGETVISIVRGYRAFVIYPGDTLEYLTSRNNFILDTFHDLFFLLSSITSDSILWWRLYVIWSRDRRVLIFPILVLLIAGICGCFVTAYDIVMATHGVSEHYQHQYEVWTETMLGTELAVNWIVTSAIIAKLYWVRHRANTFTGRKINPYAPVIIALVESGALTSVTICIFLACYGSGNAAGADVMSYALTPVLGIVPTFILLQLGLGYTQPGDALPLQKAPAAQPDSDVVLDIRRQTPRQSEVPTVRDMPNGRPIGRTFQRTEGAPSILTGYSFSFNESGVIIPADVDVDVDKTEEQHGARDVQCDSEETGPFPYVTVGRPDAGNPLRDHYYEQEDLESGRQRATVY